METSEPPMISSARVVATGGPAASPVWTYCFMVNATSAMPQVTQPGVREHLVSAAAMAPLRWQVRHEEISGGGV
jgi:hypothetical protein